MSLLRINKGYTFRHQFIWKDKDKKEINLSGYTCTVHIRKTKNSADLLQLTTSNGGVTLNNPRGSINLYIPSDQTNTLNFIDAIYIIELFAPNGDNIFLLSDKVSVS